MTAESSSVGVHVANNLGAWYFPTWSPILYFVWCLLFLLYPEVVFAV